MGPRRVRPGGRARRARRDALAAERSARVAAEEQLRAAQRALRQATLEAERGRRALSELSQSASSLAALQAAGAQLLFETDVHAVCDVLCRELARLGLHAAVLSRQILPGRDRERERGRPFRYEATSLPPRLQGVMERALRHSLAEVTIAPRASPLLLRMLRLGRVVQARSPRSAARQLLGLSAAEARRLARLLGPRHVVVAPLRWREEISGALVVIAQELGPGAAEAIDAFATQASIALEKAHLFSDLQRERARLTSEVERRTRALRRAVEALKEIDRRKDNFLANVSHELRTPLVTVLGYADLLLSGRLGELSGRQRECLGIVAVSGQRLRAFIEELLDFSRHELTRERLALSLVDVGDLVHQAVVNLAPRFQERGLRVSARVARTTPPVRGDREKLLQVLVNLLINAERHGRSAGRVRVAAAPVAGRRVALAVHDDGEGIPAEHLDHVFDRLYQVGDAAAPREGQAAGLGLGLSIAQAIVRVHGGEISATSTPGRGARFLVTLPVAGPGREPVDAPGADGVLTRGGGRSARSRSP